MVGVRHGAKGRLAARGADVPGRLVARLAAAGVERVIPVGVAHVDLVRPDAHDRPVDAVHALDFAEELAVPHHVEVELVPARHGRQPRAREARERREEEAPHSRGGSAKDGQQDEECNQGHRIVCSVGLGAGLGHFFTVEGGPGTAAG